MKQAVFDESSAPRLFPVHLFRLTSHAMA